MGFIYELVNDITDYLTYEPGRQFNKLMSKVETGVGDLYGTFTNKYHWYGGYDDPSKEDRFAFWYQVPGVQQMIDYQLDSVSWDLYKKRYGLDDSDIHDPRQKPTSAVSKSSAIRFGLNFVSDNVRRLYR